MACSGCQTKYFKMRIINPADNSVMSVGPTENFGGGSTGWITYPMSGTPPGNPPVVTGEDGNFYTVEKVEYNRVDGLCADIGNGCSELIVCSFVVRVTLKYGSSSYKNYYYTGLPGIPNDNHCDDKVRRVSSWMDAGDIKMLNYLVIDYGCDTCPGNPNPCSPLTYYEEPGSDIGTEIAPLTQEQIEDLNLPE